MFQPNDVPQILDDYCTNAPQILDDYYCTNALYFF